MNIKAGNSGSNYKHVMPRVFNSVSIYLVSIEVFSTVDQLNHVLWFRHILAAENVECIRGIDDDLNLQGILKNLAICANFVQFLGHQPWTCREISSLARSPDNSFSVSFVSTNARHICATFPPPSRLLPRFLSQSLFWRWWQYQSQAPPAVSAFCCTANLVPWRKSRNWE